MQYTTDRKWIGGGKGQTIAGDAKDASPISAVSFALNETQYVSMLQQYSLKSRHRESALVISHFETLS
jgi:hypothetical protein